jgi:hypothetical protein
MLRDAQGDEWELTVDLAACRRVRDLAKVNLLSIATADIFTALADPLRLAEILYALVRPQLVARGVTLDGFLARLGVDLNPVVDELVEQLADFFLRLGRPAKAVQLRTAATKAKELATMTTTEELREITRRTFDWMIRLIPKSFSGTVATSSPESSDSTPTSPA